MWYKKQTKKTPVQAFTDRVPTAIMHTGGQLYQHKPHCRRRHWYPYPASGGWVSAAWWITDEAPCTQSFIKPLHVIGDNGIGFYRIDPGSTSIFNTGNAPYRHDHIAGGETGISPYFQGLGCPQHGESLMQHLITKLHCHLIDRGDTGVGIYWSRVRSMMALWWSTLYISMTAMSSKTLSWK